ncbi:unnamed protein product [Moneuplotes crassus]|uniref:Uncharacterized protein n=1 Tax=Euplotes crassus TaxID=5936 RepID=A0AAD2D0J7_EUPCR|nr:unnamed protein product [Moneuplotes crassus]
MTALFFLSLLFLVTSGCDPGTFSSDQKCMPCHSSCKECMNGTECTGCEEHMFLNTTTGLCQFCPDGEFYDGTITRGCRSCEGSCFGQCGYREICFKCTDGKAFDLDKFGNDEGDPVCVAACDTSKKEVTDPTNYNVDKFCRSPKFYIDPSYEDQIELGTITHPYRTVNPVFDEILLHFSNSESDVKVYIKEGTTNFIEDSKIFIINMTSIEITTYNDTSAPAGYATIYSTDQAQTEISMKAAFNLMKDVTVDLSTITAGQGFSDYELQKIGTSGATFEATRTSITISHFVGRRIAASTQSGVFASFIYLQTKTFTLKNIDFYLSGTLVNTNDPANIFIENIYIDTYALAGGFMMVTLCNYPEAYLTPQVTMNNITYDTSHLDEVFTSRPISYLYSGPGNFSGYNWNLTNNFHLVSLGSPSGMVQAAEVCNSDDGALRTVNLDTLYISIPQTSSLSRMNAWGVEFTAEVGRIHHINISHMYIKDFIDPIYAAFGGGFTSNDVIHVTDVEASNYNANLGLIFAQQPGHITFKNMTFRDVSSGANPTFGLIFAGYSRFENIRFENYTGSQQPIGAVISTQSALTNVSMENIEIMNCNFQKQKFFQVSISITDITLKNISFINTTVDADEHIFFLNSIQQLQVDGVYLSGLKPNDLNDENTAFITINTLDLNTSTNSTISNVVYENSSIYPVQLLTMTNSPPSKKLIIFEDSVFKDSQISSEKAILTMNKAKTSHDIEVSLKNLTFSNIKFDSSGYLLLLNHQFVNNLTVSNCVFENIENGYILITTPTVSDTSIFTRVNMDNITVNNVKESTNSFITLTEQGKTYITGSRFTNVYSFSDGAVISGRASRAEIDIENCSFLNNTAHKGAVIFLSDKSYLKCTNCTFSNNFAIISGVAEVTLDGYFEFYQTQISNNYANSDPISLILDSASLSKVSNCSIYGNEALSKAQLVQEFATCSKLCFISTEYKTYSDNNFAASIIDNAEDQLFQVISGSLSILSNTKIYDQSIIINAFVSTITFEDSLIENITFGKTSIQSVFTTLTLNRMTIRNLDNTADTDFILVMLDSSFVVSDLNYSSSNSILFVVRTSSIDIKTINFDMITNATKLGEIADCYNSTIDGIHSSNSEVTSDYLFSLDTSNNITLKNFYLSNSVSSVVKIRKSNIALIDQIDIKNCSEGFLIQLSTINLVQNSIFHQNGKSNLLLGGGIQMEDSSVSIRNSTFSNNIAYVGGAIYFSCSSTVLCYLNLSNNTFEHNSASFKGGALYYDYSRPIFGDSLVYTNNTANYGNNIASYAVKVTFANDSRAPLKLNDFGSGLAYPETLNFAVRDYDDQVMNLNSQDQIRMSATNSKTTEVKGFNSAPLRNGIAEFDNLIVVAEQGSDEIQVTATSNAIDQNRIQQIFGSQISSNIITCNIRYCKPGELAEGNICRECSPGTYSLEWSSSTCEQCMEDVVCEGGSEINVNSGFWRETLNSTSIVECENKDACNGGYVDDYNQPTKCATGYKGKLCSKCDLTQDSKFQQTSEFVCQKCPNATMNAIRVFGAVIGVFIFFMIIIFVNVRKTSESQISILLRILTNYAQIITTTISFSSNHPDLLTDALVPVKSVGDSSTAFMSFDCFITDSEVTGPFPSTTFLKLFILIPLPLGVFFIVTLIWIILYCIRKSWIPDMKRYLIISFISVVFLLHPKLAQSGIDIFRCLKISDDAYKVRIDSDIDCYSMEHIKWCLILGGPILIFWVSLLPLIALVLMYRNVGVPDQNNQVQKYFLILYQGLKSKHFYWEFVNSARKIAVLIAFLLPTSIQILFSVTILICTWRLQSYFRPYKNEDNNKIEMLGVNVGIITLCCGMVFNTADAKDSLNSVLLIIMLAVNVIFIIKWMHLMVQTLAERYKYCQTLSNCISRYILFNKVLKEDNLKDKIKKIRKYQKKKLFKVKKGTRAKNKAKNSQRTKRTKNRHRKKACLPGNELKEDSVADTFRVQRLPKSFDRGAPTGSDQRFVHPQDESSERFKTFLKNKNVTFNKEQHSPDSGDSRVDRILHRKEMQRESMDVVPDLEEQIEMKSCSIKPKGHHESSKDIKVPILDDLMEELYTSSDKYSTFKFPIKSMKGSEK